MKQLSLLLVSLCISWPLLAQDSCQVVLSFPNNSTNSLVLDGTLGADQNSGEFKGILELKSEEGGAISLQSSSLRDNCNGELIPSAAIQLQSSNLSFQAGERKELMVTVKAEKAGDYRGELFFAHAASNCQFQLPLQLEVRKKGLVSVLEMDQKKTIKTIPPNWIEWLLPPRINQKSISFRVRNTGECPITPAQYSLSLIGKATNHPITEQQLQALTSTTILPKGERIVTFDLDRTDWSVPPDEYAGQLQLHVDKHAEPLRVDVTLYSRTNIGIALILLLLGILVGRIVRDLNKRKGQMDLLNKLLPLYTKINKLKNESGRSKLWAMAKDIESRIDDAMDEKSQQAIAQEILGLELKIKQYEQLEVLAKQLYGIISSREKLAEEDEDFEELERKKLEAKRKLEFLEEAIIAGKEDQIQAGTAAVLSMITELTATNRGSKSLVGEQDQAAEQAAQTVADDLQNVSLPTPEEESQLSRILTSILGFLSGIKVDGRTRYALFRPLVGLVTLVVIVLMGFQEIYIEGGDTFGSEGIYDYLKLFLWGIVSDVFSRTLLSSDVSKLAGKKS